MHLLALSAFRLAAEAPADETVKSQCTFWRSVLSDTRRVFVCHPHILVSVHLLVLSAFRHIDGHVTGNSVSGLNAPFGAQCFPTVIPPPPSLAGVWSQCTFWCSVLSD